MPIEPSYPEGRILSILEAAQPPVIVTHKVACKSIPTVWADRLVLADDCARDDVSEAESVFAKYGPLPPAATLPGTSNL